MFDSRLSFVPRIPLRLRRTAWLRGVGRAMVLGGAVAALAACGGDPLVVVGSVDVNVSADVNLFLQTDANGAALYTINLSGAMVSARRDSLRLSIRFISPFPTTMSPRAACTVPRLPR